MLSLSNNFKWMSFIIKDTYFQDKPIGFKMK